MPFARVRGERQCEAPQRNAGIKMEKISIVKRRHRNRDLETTALIRARLREQENLSSGFQTSPRWPGGTAESLSQAEEFCFEVELTPEQVSRLQHERRNGGRSSSPNTKPVIFRFNIKQAGDPETLTSREVCRVLKISRRTLYRYVKSGHLTAFRVGGGLRFLRRDVMHFLGECRIASRSS